MKDAIAALRWIVLPWGATDGQRLILDAVNGLIAIYDAVNDKIVQIDTSGMHFYDGSGTEQATIGPDSNGSPMISVQTGPIDEGNDHIAMFVDGATPTFEMTAYDTPGGLGLSYQMILNQFGAGTGAFARLNTTVFGDPDCTLRMLGGSSDGTAKAYVEVNAPIKAMVSNVTETWRAFAFSGAWVDSAGAVPARYRKMPDGTAMAKGRIQGGAIAVGSALFTLPVDYRPSQNVRFTVAQGSAAAGTDPAIDISAATGVATLARAPSAAFIYLDGMRWPTTDLS